MNADQSDRQLGRCEPALKLPPECQDLVDAVEKQARDGRCVVIPLP
jgi:hypothetical protein